MDDRENLYRGLSDAAWGYFLLNFNINLSINRSSVSILPQFAGYLLLLFAIGRLAEERRDLALLRPLGGLLTLWSLGDWLLSWLGQDLDGRIVFLDLIVAVAGLYFQFQFLTDMAALAEAYKPAEDNDLDRRIRRRRSAYVVLITLIALSLDLPLEFLGEWRDWLTVGLAAAACIVSLFIMAALFELRKFFLEGDEPPVS